MLATAGGSLPGTDFRSALDQMRHLLPEVLAWPELPDRGAGASMIGRGAALLVDMPVVAGRAGWEVAAHRDAAARRAVATWRNDLDDFEELCGDFAGVVKVGVVGPWTLAAGLHRPRAEVMLADRGARAGVAGSLTEGVRELIADISRRAPAARVVLQVDEPALCAVAAGQVPTQSGLTKLAAIETEELVANLAPLARGAVLHACCRPQWVAVGSAAGFSGLYPDTAALTGPDIDAAAEFLASGKSLILGVLRADKVNVVPHPDELVADTLGLLDLLGADRAASERIQLAPSCGLAGWDARCARDALRALRQAAKTATSELAH